MQIMKAFPENDHELLGSVSNFIFFYTLLMVKTIGKPRQASLRSRPVKWQWF
jgi:hypothetical protein